MKRGARLLLLVACLALAEGGFLVERHRAATDLEIEKPSEREQLFQSVDKDKDGKLNFADFKAFLNGLAAQSKTEPAKEEAQKMMFKNMDADNDGFVSLTEFKSFKPASASAPQPKAAAAAGGTKPVMPQAAAGQSAPGNGLKCVAWRKTTTCVPSGPRDPLQDKDCLTVIGGQESGFCECEGFVHTAAVPCGHDPLDCTVECGRMQKLHRETFGGKKGPGGGDEPCPLDEVAASTDPYGQALRYGHKAMKDVNEAVDHSNQLLGSARNMISKMMNIKPWKEITKLGKDAEEAGKKTEMLAKLARPYIYAQVNEKSN